MKYDFLKPKKRTDFRIRCGKIYYRSRRHVDWMIHNKDFVSSQIDHYLDHMIYEHKTPLIRNLQGVDMQVHLNKIENLKIAIKTLDGILIKPNETLSYWKCIGKPTSKKGYVPGMVLDHGKYKMGVGGGLCQLSNMLFWLILHSPLDVKERHRHSYDVFPDSKRTQPFGSGATCVYNYRDLQIINNTNETYQLKFYLDDQYLNGELLSNQKKYFSYEVFESDHHITHEYWGGYLRHNQINRRIKDLDHNLVEEQYICENHALMMYAPLLE